MIACLRQRTDDKLCLDAANELESMREERLRLSHRIHEQRVNLRRNWQIVEQRTAHTRAWVRSPLLTSILCNRWKPKPWWRRLVFRPK